MIDNEQTFSVDIPAAELPEGLVPAIAKEPKAKPAPKAPVEVKPDPRDDELRQSREALAQAHADRERLTKELTTTRQAATNLHGRANDLERENHKRTGQALYAHGQATYSEHQQVINAIHATKMETAAAKQELETALNDDNIDARERARRIADAQERIALAAADSRTLEHGRTTLEEKLKEAQRNMEAHMRTRPKGEPDPEVEPPKREEPKAPEQQEDPFERYVKQFPKVSQDWLREHPEYVKEERLNKRLQAAALEWDAEGKPLHTSEFINHLTGKFFKKEEPVTTDEDDGETEEIDTAEPAPAPKAKSAPAAPVSRSSQPTKGSNAKATKVQLSNDERQHAIALYGAGTKYNLSPEDAMKRYGGRKLQATADGKYEAR